MYIDENKVISYNVYGSSDICHHKMRQNNVSQVGMERNKV